MGKMDQTQEIQALRQEVRQLWILYRKLADRIIPEEEPTPEEKEALDSKDEYVEEEEALQTLTDRIKR
jgi:hypothetical protein